MTRIISVLATVFLWATAPAPALAQPAAPPPVTVQRQISRTAVWAGDPITYTVEITCPPGTDILTEDLARDRLRLQGLDLSSSEMERQPRPDGTVVHRARFHLASYSTDTTSLRIEPIRVRYYIRQPGQRIENMTPAGEVEVPAIDIALRSTLPDSEPSGIRDVRAPVFLPASAELFRLLGVAAVALSCVPVLLGIAATLARRRSSRGLRRSKRRPEENRAALEEIRHLDGATSAARREAFDRLDNLVREYLTDLDIPARSLTPDEIQERVTKRLHAPGDLVGSVLRDCQRARYGGPGQLPDAATLGRALDQTGEMLASRVR